jgi:hypothetical protein
MEELSGTLQAMSGSGSSEFQTDPDSTKTSMLELCLVLGPVESIDRSRFDKNMEEL